MEELGKEETGLLLQWGAALLAWGKALLHRLPQSSSKGTGMLSLWVEPLRVAKKAGTDTGFQCKGATISDNLEEYW